MSSSSLFCLYMMFLLSSIVLKYSFVSDLCCISLKALIYSAALLLSNLGKLNPVMIPNCSCDKVFFSVLNCSGFLTLMNISGKLSTDSLSSSIAVHSLESVDLSSISASSTVSSPIESSKSRHMDFISGFFCSITSCTIFILVAGIYNIPPIAYCSTSREDPLLNSVPLISISLNSYFMFILSLSYIYFFVTL